MLNHITVTAKIPYVTVKFKPLLSLKCHLDFKEIPFADSGESRPNYQSLDLKAYL